MLDAFEAMEQAAKDGKVILFDELSFRADKPVPLKRLIRNGGFVFAMCGLVVLAILVATMGYQSW